LTRRERHFGHFKQSEMIAVTRRKSREFHARINAGLM
jgi:hypothetical protein